jgi:hypothetical protein
MRRFTLIAKFGRAKTKRQKSPSDIEIMVKPSALVILQPGRAEHKLA